MSDLRTRIATAIIGERFVDHDDCDECMAVALDEADAVIAELGEGLAGDCLQYLGIPQRLIVGMDPRPLHKESRDGKSRWVTDWEAE
jgi:hypothetical protein